MKVEADSKQVANTYQTAYSHNKAQYSSNQKSENQFSEILPDKHTHIMRRSTNYGSEVSKQYAAMRSRNFTAYTSNQLPEYPSSSANPRYYRLNVIYLENQCVNGEFIAYCVANKESNSGIFSHERLFVINSLTKSLMYFSMIPNLPLKAIASLKDPKETIQLVKVNKLLYTPRTNSISQVQISWLEQDGKKEWCISMGNKKMIKQFGMVLTHIKQREEISLWEVRQSIRDNSNSSRFNSSDKDTPFILDIKHLQAKKQSKKSHKITFKPSPGANSKSMLKKQSKQKVPAMQQKQDKIDAKQNQDKKIGKQKQDKLYAKQKSVQKYDEQSSRQFKIHELINIAQLQYFKAKQEKEQLNIQPQQQSKLRENPVQKIEQLVQKAEELANNNIDPQSYKQTESFYKEENYLKLKAIINKITQGLRKITQNEQQKAQIINKQIQQSQPMEQNNTPNITIDLSKILVSLSNMKQLRNIKQQTIIQNQQRPSTSQTDIAKQSPNSRFQNFKLQQIKHAQRLALLQQRKKNSGSSIKGKTSFRGKDKLLQSQNTKNLGQQSSRFSKYQTGWIVKWLSAKNKAQLAQVYCKFIDYCFEIVQAQIQEFTQKYGLLRPLEQFLNDFQAQRIHFTYVLNEQSKHKKETSLQQTLVSRLKTNSYLLSCIKFKQRNWIQLGVPLCCIIQWKGLQVYCEAALKNQKLLIVSNEQLRLRYAEQLAYFQQLSRVSLKEAQLHEVKLNNRTFLYFKSSNIFPHLRKSNIELDGHYISKFIKQGVIKNEADLEMITHHLEKEVINQTLLYLQRQNFCSSVQLLQSLERHGLNQTCVDRLLELSLKKKYKRCTCVCLGELISKQLAGHIRQRILSQAPKTVLQVVYHQLNSWLKEDGQILQIIRQRLQKYSSCINFNLIGHFRQQYVLASVLESLGLNIAIKARPKIEKIELEAFQLWKEMQFTKENALLNFRQSIIQYSYEVFQQHYEILNKNLFMNQKIVISEDFNKDILLSLINKQQNAEYCQSELFRLMSAHQKIKVNQYLAHFLPYDLKQSYTMSHPQHMYYCLKNNSTSYILSKQNFNTCLMGINWLIKLQNKVEATIRLEQQLLRVLIWCKSHPRLIIDIYDLKAKYSELVRNEQQFLKSGLISLQTAINYLNNFQEGQCTEIVARCLRLADNHFKQAKCQKAGQLYKIAVALMQKMEDKEIQEFRDEQFLQIYNRQTKIALALCRIDEALRTCSYSRENFQRYSSLFRDRKDILQKIAVQQFNTYLLQLRCYQILADHSSILNFIAEVSKKFIEKDIQNSLQNQAIHSYSEFTNHKFVQIVKYLWTAIVSNSNQLKNTENDQLSTDISKITEYVQAIRRQNRELYRYSILEVYNHIVAIIVKKKSGNISGLDNDSILLTLILRNFETLSRGKFNLSRGKIYDEKSNQDQVLFLECLVQITGYSFAVGTLMRAQNEHIF